MLEHGGHLRAAANQYDIPLTEWTDLSTGINPDGWPIPPIPVECWQRLPETDDGLVSAAQDYYQASSILPVAGSQAAIQTLPHLRPCCRVGVLHPAYAEHAESWRKNGHHIVVIDPKRIEASLAELDVLILINPNNPTGQAYSRTQLLHWHQSLQRRGGWLIVDEAFIDCQPQNSLALEPAQPGLIVLRSIGKFFGLAGIRCGFVIGAADLLQQLNEKFGPWPISHPTRYIAIAALQDKRWQQQTREKLPLQAERLHRLLSKYGLPPEGGCELFQWLKTEQASDIHHRLAKQGILTRLFEQPSSIRFGLPAHQRQWLALEMALASLS
ncbi:threonine-phosphate decarboxylase CobD [Methylomarinum sp. Ch1-1]|uniref:threonine-phosphate decarboxylase n=1 Tax=Methylomarinum roseum TaxID=3067653 RepID=A0AAU7NV83_9GAMM|nr:threonine-phosphate decarboxylase CobD [Methylomarinum sp. Ch1-1]MDP4523018.1 threonine-phosphate decarboxylase CobD [Methylomarinum sp. Ch1-1]